MNNANQDRSFERSAASAVLIIVAFCLSASWLALAYRFLVHQFPCDSLLLVSCIKQTSDWGDFFAGAFSPLAFIWLVLAVILQSMELKAQRHELALTRLEYRESRAVAQVQSEESARQAEFIGQQTKILQRQEKLRLQENALAQFNAALEVLAARLVNYDHCWDFTLQAKTVIKVRLATYASQSDRRIVIGTSQEVRTAIREALASLPSTNAGAKLRATYPHDYLKVYRSLLNCVETAKILEGAAQQLARDLEMDDLQKNMETLMGASGNF